MHKRERYGLVWDAHGHRCQGSAFQVDQFSYFSFNNEQDEWVIWPPLKDVVLYLRNSMHWLKLMVFIFPVFILAMCVQVTTEWPGLIQQPKVLDLGPSLSHLSQRQGSCWSQWSVIIILCLSGNRHPIALLRSEEEQRLPCRPSHILRHGIHCQ